MGLPACWFMRTHEGCCKLPTAAAAAAAVAAASAVAGGALAPKTPAAVSSVLRRGDTTTSCRHEPQCNTKHHTPHKVLVGHSCCWAAAALANGSATQLHTADSAAQTKQHLLWRLAGDPTLCCYGISAHAVRKGHTCMPNWGCKACKCCCSAAVCAQPLGVRCASRLWS